MNWICSISCDDDKTALSVCLDGGVDVHGDWLFPSQVTLGKISLWQAEQSLAGQHYPAISSWSTDSLAQNKYHQM